MKKILFLIHDLGPGGAEKVLVNLVNHMDQKKFDVTVMTLFNEGVNREALAQHIHYRSWLPKSFPGNSHFLKLFSPQFLYSRLIGEGWDIVVSYLEGPSSRIVLGAPVSGPKVASWVHIQMSSEAEACVGFRDPREARRFYARADRLVFVSSEVRSTFCRYITPECPTAVLYNTNLSEEIRRLSHLELPEAFRDVMKVSEFHWCGIGKLIPRKGFDRMLRVQKRLLDAGYAVRFHILGNGPMERGLKRFCRESGIESSVTFWGYQRNPYAVLARCDCFACASFGEGFSTAATESLIVGTPVCTVNAGGMKELLGTENQYGIVTENTEDALYSGIRSLIEDPHLLEKYRLVAEQRGKDFDTARTVQAVEEMLLSL